MKKLVILGAGGHGLVVADAVLAMGGYELVGFAAKRFEVKEVLGVAPLLGTDIECARIVNEYQVDAFVVAVGDNHVRMAVIKRLRQELPSEVSFPSVVHPTATVGMGASIGEGSVILASAVIAPGVQVGIGCLVNNSALLDHHGWLGDYASLAPGVMCGGEVRIGEGSAVCIGATVVHGREVGAWSVVGAGATVIEDVPDGVVAYGTPARVVRERVPDDSYL